MGTFQDITGNKYGHLTVIERSLTKNKKTFWICKCDCGNITSVYRNHLISGHTASCGHCNYMESINSKLNLIDLTGKQFGQLTVISRADDYIFTNGRKGVRWLCKCTCGNITTVWGNSLRNGDTISCGLHKLSKGELKIKSILEQNNINFEQQKTFDDCKDKYVLPFDFFIDNKYIIEFDGAQHNQKTGWLNSKLDYIQNHDQIKNEYCFNHNIPIIRIPYTKYDTLSLEDLLLESSKFLININ